MVCDAADVSYYKMQVYPGKDAALQEGTKPVNNGQKSPKKRSLKPLSSLLPVREL